jgi:hypothetical protein
MHVQIALDTPGHKARSTSSHERRRTPCYNLYNYLRLLHFPVATGFPSTELQSLQLSDSLLERLREHIETRRFKAEAESFRSSCPQLIDHSFNLVCDQARLSVHNHMPRMRGFYQAAGR